ncbi:MAG: glycerol-3-phosphate dehydrogenase/oxidase, partial [Planctomycetota bacterium JB042]
MNEADERLEASTFDVLVVGAGIAGAASAAALSAAGASVALVDRADFGAGTSQESSNLIWGGLKYLENGEVGLVSRLCAARNRLLEAFPTGVREIRFVAAVDRTATGFTRSALALLAGGWAYWLFGRGRTKVPRWLGEERLGARAPMLVRGRFKGALEYSDAVLADHDARFVFSFVREAARRGAIVRNYLEVAGARRDGDRWSVDAVDRDGGATRTIRARVLVNAAGPHVDALNAAVGVSTRTRLVFSKGIHLIVDRIAPDDRVLAFFDERDRPFFVIPLGGRSAIGTTDTSVESPTRTVTEDDRRFLLDHVNARLDLAAPLTEADVIAERCGVRALAVRGTPAPGESWLALSRKHVLEIDRERAHLSIFGGKLTDCLHVGEEVVDAVRSLGVAVRPPGRWFGEPPAARR